MQLCTLWYASVQDPSFAIPVGTLAAIFTTYVSYVLYSTMLGAVAVRDASGIVSELNFDAGNILESKAFQCTDRKCSYGLLNSFQVLQASTFRVTDGVPSAQQPRVGLSTRSKYRDMVEVTIQ